MAGMPQHDVSIVIGGSEIRQWSEYEIESVMTQPANSFHMTRPFDADAWNLCKLDSRVRVRIDGVTVLDGFIDDRHKATARDGSKMTITGRSKGSRLVDESTPFIAYDGLDLVTVARRLVGLDDPTQGVAWFDSVVTSNARNRTVVRGRGRKVASGAEPLIVKVRKKTWQVEPGQSRWKILNELCTEAGYMAWASGDGTEIVIGQPNYTQAVQYLVSNPAPGSQLERTAINIEHTESIAERYSLIMALGSGAGDAVN